MGVVIYVFFGQDGLCLSIGAQTVPVEPRTLMLSRESHSPLESPQGDRHGGSTEDA